MAAVNENVGEALRALHKLGVVHCDVAPNNILRVCGEWKLIDLDSCVSVGSPAIRRPNAAYCHPDRKDGSAPARPAWDEYGLEQVTTVLRESFWQQ